MSLRGEGGSGKSAVLDTFGFLLASGDDAAAPRVARGAAAYQPEHYRPVRSALRGLLDAEFRRGHDAGRRMVTLLRTAGPYWLGAVPGIGKLLEGLAVGVDAAVQAPAGEFVDDEADQLSRLLRTLSGERPLVLALDDLQRVDEGTISLLLTAARELRGTGARLLIVAAWRSEEPAGRLPIQRAVRDLARYVHTEDVQLRRLDAPEVTAFVAELVGAPPTSAVTRMLLRITEGVPLAVEELTRELEKRIGPEPDEWTPERLGEAGLRLTDLSQTQSVLDARLDGLDEDERRLLDVAAVAGPEFGAGTVVRVAARPDDLTEANTTRTLRILTQRHGLIRPAPAAGTYRLCHNLLREHLLDQLRDDPWDYAQLHRRVAELLESESDPDRWWKLVHHYREAGQEDAGLAALARACEAAYDGGVWREGIAHLAEQALAWVGPDGDPAQRARALLAIAEAAQARADFRTALRAAERSRALAESAGDDWSLAGALVVLASTEDGQNEHDAQLELLDQAAARYQGLRAAGDGTERVLPRLLQAWYTKAWLAMRTERWDAHDQALAEAERAVVTLEGSAPGAGAGTGWDDPERWWARLAQVRGEALAERGRWAEAKEALADVRSWCRMRRDLLGEAAARGWYGVALCRTGHLDEGLREVRAAQEIERDRLGSREGAAKWLHLLGELHAERDELELAAETLWLARDLRDDLGHVGANDTTGALRAVRDRMGEREYARLRLSFDPAASRYGRYAFVWRLPVFGNHARVILAPTGDGEEAVAVFNPGAYDDGRLMILPYRAVGERAGGGEVSSIRLALSADGQVFWREPRPLIVMTEPYERPGRPGQSGGCEDPRLVRFPDGLTMPDGSPLPGRFALTYNAYDGTVARAVLAFSDDLVHWRKAGLIFDTAELDQREHAPRPPGTPQDWAKSAVLLDEIINGRFWLYFGDTHIWAASSRDLRHWRIVPRPVLSPRPGAFDARLVEPGPPPLLRPDGILLVYNGAEGPDENLRCAVGQAFISRHDPTRVVARAVRPLVTATDPAATIGRVPNVVFATGLVWRDGVCHLYLGLADTRVGVAVTRPRHPSTAPS